MVDYGTVAIAQIEALEEAHIQDRWRPQDEGSPEWMLTLSCGLWSQVLNGYFLQILFH